MQQRFTQLLGPSHRTVDKNAESFAAMEGHGRTEALFSFAGTVPV